MLRRWRLRGLAALSVAAMVSTLMSAVSAPPAGATSGFSTTRIAGTDRYDTAARAALAAFGSGAATAVIATGANYPDALAGAYLAGTAKGPVLLVAPNTPIPEPTLQALQTLKTQTVILLGGPNAIGNDVQTQLSQTPSTASGGANLSVSRVQGPTRYDTAVAIATSGGPLGTVNGQRTAIVASGANFPDALAGGPAAFASHLPILLTDPASESPQTEQALRQLNITQVVLLGGTAAVSDAVATQLSNGGSRTVVRIGGVDRTDTAAQFYDWAIHNLGFKNTAVDLANGANFPDALAGAAQAGGVPTAILLTEDPFTLGSPTTNEAQKLSSTLASGVVLGGTNAVSGATASAFAQAAGASQSATSVITLASSSTQAGSTIRGTVSNPGSVQSITASGCGLTNQSVSFNATSGALTLTIPASQPAGQCTLSFTVTPTNGGAASTQAFTITIVATSAVTTAGPDLVSAAITTTATNDVVTYTFDKTQLGINPPVSKFHIYNAAGTELTPTTGAATVSGGSVSVPFPKGSTAGAVLATVSPGAAATVNGIGNPIGDVVPTGAAPPPPGTAAPDLSAVQNFVFSATGCTAPAQSCGTADFLFDKPVDATALAALPDSTGFGLISTDNRMVCGSKTAKPTLSTTNTATVTVRFDNLDPAASTCPSSPPTTSACVPSAATGPITAALVARGAVAKGQAKSTTSAATNPLQTAAAVGGASSAKTTSLQLSSITIDNSTTAEFVFDTGVDANTVTAARFAIYDASGATVAGQSALRSSTDTTRVVVTLASAVLSPAGGSADVGAVKAIANGQCNMPTSLPAASATSPAPGRTARPNLTAVKFSADSFGDPVVKFIFDASLPANYGVSCPMGATAANCDFVLYDSNATALIPGCGQGACSVSGNTVTIAAATPLQAQSGLYGFSSAQLSAAVLGACQDSVGQPSFAYFPEGAQPPTSG